MFCLQSRQQTLTLQVSPALVGSIAWGERSWQVYGQYAKKTWYLLSDVIPLEETRWNDERFDVKKVVLNVSGIF